MKVDLTETEIKNLHGGLKAAIRSIDVSLKNLELSLQARLGLTLMEDFHDCEPHEHMSKAWVAMSQMLDDFSKQFIQTEEESNE